MYLYIWTIQIILCVFKFILETQWHVCFHDPIMVYWSLWPKCTIPEFFCHCISRTLRFQRWTIHENPQFFGLINVKGIYGFVCSLTEFFWGLTITLAFIDESPKRLLHTNMSLHTCIHIHMKARRHTHTDTHKYIWYTHTSLASLIKAKLHCLT